MRCIVHAGMHKTGTTSIQHALSHELGGQGSCRYVDLGNPNHSAPLATAFRTNPESLHYCVQARKDPSRIPFLRESLLQRLEEELGSTGDTAILSAEELGYFEDAELDALRSRILEHADTVEVIVYLRPIRGEVISRFQQNAKGIRIGFGELPPVLDYRAPLERLDRVFGTDSVTVRCYEPSMLLNGCVVQDFCATAGLPALSSTAESLNRSLNRHGLALLYASRWHDATHAPERLIDLESEGTLAALSQLPSPPAAFANDILRSMAALEEQNLDWTEQRVGFSLRHGLDEPNADYAITSIDHLVQLDEASLFWLAEQSGMSTTTDAYKFSRIQWIADAMHRFRQRHG